MMLKCCLWRLPVADTDFIYPTNFKMMLRRTYDSNHAAHVISTCVIFAVMYVCSLITQNGLQRASHFLQVNLLTSEVIIMNLLQDIYSL